MPSVRSGEEEQDEEMRRKKRSDEIDLSGEKKACKLRLG
jgi:hypothetical protein